MPVEVKINIGEVTDEKLDVMLNTDPIQVAEDCTGKSYKEDKATEALGFLAHIAHNQAKRKVLESIDDTTFSEKVDRYLRIAGEEGFKVVLEVPFTVQKSYDNQPRDEKFYVMWKADEGLLLTFDTYNTTGVNSAHLRFCLKPFDKMDTTKYHAYCFNGEWVPKIRTEPHENGGRWRKVSEDRDHHWKNHVTHFVGSHDAREALRFMIRKLRSCGTLEPQWLGQPHMWMLHYGDTDAIDKEIPYVSGPSSTHEQRSARYDQITKERLAMLPSEVFHAITPESEECNVVD